MLALQRSLSKVRPHFTLKDNTTMMTGVQQTAQRAITKNLAAIKKIIPFISL